MLNTPNRKRNASAVIRGISSAILFWSGGAQPYKTRKGKTGGRLAAVFKYPAACLNSRRIGRLSFEPSTIRKGSAMSEVTTVGALPPIPMIVRDGHPRVTSREVAEFFGKRHDNILQSIQSLDCSENFGRLNFQESTYQNAQNKPQPMVEMTRDGFAFLAMGFTGQRAAQFKEAFIAAFNAMEAQLRGTVPPAIQASVDAVGAKVDQLGSALQQMANSTTALVNSTLTVQAQLQYAGRYVAMLEMNQRGHAKPTREMEAQAQALLVQGMTITSIAKLLRTSRTTAHSLAKGTYALSQREAARPPLSVQAVLDQMIATQQGAVLALISPDGTKPVGDGPAAPKAVL